MTNTRGKGSGPAWQDLVNAGDETDPATTEEPTPRGGQRNPRKGKATTAQEPTKQAPPASLPSPVVHQRAARPKTSQFNVRISVDLIGRVNAEVDEYDQQGLTRHKADIVAEALTLYYDTKDGKTA